MNDRLIMGGKVHDLLGLIDSSTTKMNDNGQQICYLARTNLKLFMKTVQVLGCDVKRNSQTPIPKISFVGVKIHSKVRLKVEPLRIMIYCFNYRPACIILSIRYFYLILFYRVSKT